MKMLRPMFLVEKPVSAKIDCGEVKEHNPCVPKMKVGVSTV